eukprot:UN00389
MHFIIYKIAYFLGNHFNEYNAARNHCELAIKYDPQNASYRHNIAWLLTKHR